MAEKSVVVVPDPETLATSVAARFLGKVALGLAEERDVHVSLTGGTMGIAVLRATADNPMHEMIDWSRVHLWWSDERFVPRADGDRNARQAREAFIERIAIPAENVHEMPATDDGMDLDAAAEHYAAELARFGSDARPYPIFDVTFLGVGPDGHIASLFPDRDEILVTDRTALPVRNSPKPPPERITLTRPVINASLRVWMVVSGAEKAGALGLILAGASYASVPAAGAKGTVRTVIIVDEAAAGEVPPELIDPDF
ncbi:6-phosphogluconolactonase [Microbacterium gorillae]|uniref:6-phosphogluconolactonase n=1 Tax=Microbacterium gorillae TaxID=1231063 RepID=UPI00058ED904|nr:6-phosphogluconolactonase [Microbacterium gorillae]